jgi:hypothetical protein
VRFILSGILFAVLACGLIPAVFAQSAAGDPGQKAKPKDQMFSGVVTAVEEDSLTAMRTGQGKAAETKTFAVTPQTRFEGGKPKVDSRVTVRYVSTDDGDQAVHIIVRGPAKK